MFLGKFADSSTFFIANCLGFVQLKIAPSLLRLPCQQIHPSTSNKRLFYERFISPTHTTDTLSSYKTHSYEPVYTVINFMLEQSKMFITGPSERG